MSRYINYIFLAVATLSAIILRTVMSFFIVDVSSGFVKSENLSVAIFIAIILLLAAAAVCFFGARSETKKLKKPSFKGALPSVVSLLLGLAIIISAFTPSLLSTWQKGLEMLLSLGFGLYLILYAFGNLVRIKLPDMLWIIPVVYWLVKLVNVFTTYAALSNTFDNIFEIFTLCSVLFFFLSLAKCLCLETNKKNIKTLKITSYLACFMSFSCSVPKAIIVLTNNQSILGDNKSFIILFLTGLYMLSFMLQNNKKPQI